MDTEVQEEINERLEELTSMVKEDHKMIKSLYSRAKWASVFVFFKWLIIIAVTVGSFYYIQPFIDSFMKAYNAVSGSPTSGSPSFFKGGLDLLKQFQSTSTK